MFEPTSLGRMNEGAFAVKHPIRAIFLLLSRGAAGRSGAGHAGRCRRQSDGRWWIGLDIARLRLLDPTRPDAANSLVAAAVVVVVVLAAAAATAGCHSDCFDDLPVPNKNNDIVVSHITLNVGISRPDLPGLSALAD